MIGITYPWTDAGNRRGVRHVDPDGRNVAATLKYRQTNYQRKAVAAATGKGRQRTRRRTLVHDVADRRLSTEHTDKACNYMEFFGF